MDSDGTNKQKEYIVIYFFEIFSALNNRCNMPLKQNNQSLIQIKESYQPMTCVCLRTYLIIPIFHRNVFVIECCWHSIRGNLFQNYLFLLIMTRISSTLSIDMNLQNIWHFSTILLHSVSIETTKIRYFSKNASYLREIYFEIEHNSTKQIYSMQGLTLIDNSEIEFLIVNEFNLL